MPDTATLRPRSPDRPRLRFQWWYLPIAIAAVAIIIAVPRLFASPAAISELTIVNHTPYAIDVQVSDGHDNGATELPTAERDRTTVARDIVDQGDTWVFTFDSQGVDGGELRISKADLERAGWKIDIPESVGTRLAGEGAPPTPPPGF